MRITILLFIFLTVLFNPTSVEAQKRRPAITQKHLSASEVAKTVLQSLVLIVTEDENGRKIGQGSGFVYRPGLVVTNLHVFERASNAVVKNVSTGKLARAIEVVAMSAIDDICIIRIDNTDFPVLKTGDAASVKTGDDIYVASNPKGLEGTITKGIVSSVRKRFRKSNDPTSSHLPDLDEYALPNLFQIDAAISAGSSGGALVNTKGEAIGIIRSTIVGGQNLNFAIPIYQMVSLPHKFSHSIQLAGACAYTDKQKAKLKGPVQKVIERELSNELKTNSSNAKAMGLKFIVSSEKTYDVDGNLAEDVVYQITDGKLLWKHAYTYDENRLRTSFLFDEVISGHVDKTDLIPALSIKYKLTDRKFSQVLDSKETGIWVYDSGGNLIERRFGIIFVQRILSGSKSIIGRGKPSNSFRIRSYPRKEAVIQTNMHSKKIVYVDMDNPSKARGYKIWRTPGALKRKRHPDRMP